MVRIALGSFVEADDEDASRGSVVSGVKPASDETFAPPLVERAVAQQVQDVGFRPSESSGAGSSGAAPWEPPPLPATPLGFGQPAGPVAFRSEASVAEASVAESSGQETMIADAAPITEVQGLPGVNQDEIDKAFHEIDFDGNGFISVSELRYLLYTMGERPNDEELDEMVRMLDTEGRGQVALDEFTTLFHEGSPVLAEMICQAPQVEAAPKEKLKAARLTMEEREAERKSQKLAAMALGGFVHASKMHRKSKAGGLPKAKKLPSKQSARLSRHENESDIQPPGF